MKLAFFTNTFTPHVGGVANSVASLACGMRERGHACLVLAPEFPGQPAGEKEVVRIPSIQNFSGTDFSFKLPSGTLIGEAIKAFRPDLIHSHHPFLLGDAALRMAHEWDLPLVFTHHTRYENYVHYVLAESDWLKRLAVELATEYANLCDQVIAPSGSIAALISSRGVTVPVETIPTGIDRERFREGNRDRARQRLGLPEEAFVIGHVGRLAPEKNLVFLVSSACHYMAGHSGSFFVISGAGECEAELRTMVGESGMSGRVRFAGRQPGTDLVDLYHALDVFVFSSKSETQGMVIGEAMAAGLPVVALDASGVRDIVTDGRNGRLLPEDATEAAFAQAIHELREQLDRDPASIRRHVERTARAFSSEACFGRLEAVYRKLVDRQFDRRDLNGWTRFMSRLEAEWELAQSRARAVGASLRKKP